MLLATFLAGEFGAANDSGFLYIMTKWNRVIQEFLFSCNLVLVQPSFVRNFSVLFCLAVI